MAKSANNKKPAEIFAGSSNGAETLIGLTEPYVAEITLEGTEKILMHFWNNEAIREKANAKKNSAVKKTDNPENYVMRNESGALCIPGLNFCASIRDAGKSFSDPTSPRKSLRDRLKAILIPLDELAPINGGANDWDFIDSRRVVIQRAGITRDRPGFYKGWTVTFRIGVLEPEFVDREMLIKLIENAGKFQGLGDYRPTFGRYRLAGIKISPWED